MSNVKRLVFVLVLLFFQVVCGKCLAVDPAKVAEAETKNPVLAKVNSKQITMEELKAYCWKDRSALVKATALDRKKLLEKKIEQLVEMEVMYQAAQEHWGAQSETWKKLDSKAQVAVESDINDLRKLTEEFGIYGQSTDLEVQLKKMGTSLNFWRQFGYKQFMILEYIKEKEEIVKKAEPASKEALNREVERLLRDAKKKFKIEIYPLEQ